ncbi:MAG: hypothetical protein PHO63_01680 [Bacilli bacterium]|nr:hypothetical protein [Bacilli bacterium]MDD4808916.1 hypothetical protein [Bacilli bacterium]
MNKAQKRTILIGIIVLLLIINIINIVSTYQRINDQRQADFMRKVEAIVKAVNIHGNNNIIIDELEYKYIDENLYYINSTYNSEKKHEEIIKMDEILENGSGTIMFNKSSNEMKIKITDGVYCAISHGREINITKGNCDN